MTGPDRQTEGVEPRPDPGSMPYFPGMAQHPGTAPPPAGAGAVPLTMHGSPGDVTVAVEGRITIEDAVLEKIAALAALEVAGVAGPGPAGARVTVAEHDGDDEVVVDLVIAVEYGSVVKDVAQAVQGNVARVTGLMLGTRIAAVNVTVQDVRMPAAPPPPRRAAGQTPRA
jgi:uncharacterized alkaline shock family protein YloU